MDRTMLYRARLLAFVAFAVLLGCSDDTNTNNDEPTNVVDVDAGDTTPEDACQPGDPACGEVDPCDQANCRPDQRCTSPSDVAQCSCPAGTTDDGTVCVPDASCTDTTCNESGTCTEGVDGPECSCNTGWTGEFCDQCDTAAGYQPGPDGGCTDDPCDLLTCEGDQVCVTDGETAECHCPAGTHLEGDQCAADETCGPTSCAGNGDCTDGDGTVSCTCDDGWAQPFCQDCDTSAGYHPDGMGGCTTDPCAPNPCSVANQTTCVSPDGISHTCECDTGYHFDATDTCVPDEACQPGSCSGNGSCDDTTLEVECTCDVGFIGDTCDQCDTANGFHPDGMGGCTNDPCLPNPCTDPNKTECTSSATNYTCSCDPGFHPDGMGGCTDDPCTPNTCANNQACRDNNGTAECYTPDCDDQNPCTNDALVNGVCQHTDRADGSACSTTECTDNQVCTAGTCGGGGPRDCDDSNPCTADTCDAVQGCVNDDDDTLVPDDGIACTVDTCSAGVAQNLPDTGLCDDGAFCNGDEVCRPTDPSANAAGCVTENVPVAPNAPGPCQYYGGCDESSDSFPLVSRAAGEACDDGVYCTSGDTCDASGVCVGAFDATCSGTASCGSTTPLGSTIDIPQAYLDLTVTVGGQPLPATSNDHSQFTIWAVAKDTGVRHYLSRWNYDYSTDQLEGPYDSDRLVAGVYDIVYDRYASSRTYSDDLAPYGERVLMSDVVLTRGQNTLDIDIPQTQLTLDLTIGGQPLPATSNDHSQFTIWAVAKDTGVRHYLSRWNYDYSTDQLEGPYDTDRLVSGTYDIVYDRYASSRTYANDLAPYGERVLMSDVVISGASQSLDIDIPQTQLTLDLTIGGQPLPATSNDHSQFTIWAVAKDTGVRHYLSRWNYDYSTDQLEGPYDTDRLVSGTYDIVYDRYASSRTYANDLAPYGERVLMSDVVISGASQVINIDIPQTQLTLDLTIGGQPLPATSNDHSQFTIWAVAKDTGVRHYLSRWNYDYSTDQLEGPYDTDRLVSGTYDIVYDRYASSRTYPNDLAPYGERVLMSDVVISGASQAINIDIPQTQLTLDLTIGGQPLPATSNDHSQFTIWAVAKDTGVRHYLSRWNYDYSTDQLEGPYDTDRLVSGTYDIVYDRYASSRTYANDLAPYGERVLMSDVVISGASQSLDIDIPQTQLTFDFSVDGQPLPAISNDHSQFTVWAVARDTGVRHYLSRWNYDYSTDQLEGPFDTHRLVTGTYDILYDRYASSRTYPNDLAPYGERYLGVCVEVQ